MASGCPSASEFGTDFGFSPELVDTASGRIVGNGTEAMPGKFTFTMEELLLFFDNPKGLPIRITAAIIIIRKRHEPIIMAFLLFWETEKNNRFFFPSLCRNAPFG